MTSKLPWAAAAVIIVVAAVAAWAIWGQAPAVPPTGAATITAIVGPGTVWAEGTPADNASGIENVYIVLHSAAIDYASTNLSGNANNLGVITANLGTASIAYETKFDIVVAVKAGTDNMAYATKENMNVGLAISGSFTLAEENAGGTINSHMAAYSWDNSGYGTTSGYLQINAVWDNDGEGYKLPADGSITLSNIKLWGWK